MLVLRRRCADKRGIGARRPTWLLAIAHRLIILAFGTSTPELAVSVDAAIQGHGDIAVGSVIGSNIVNIAFVLGATAVFRCLPTSAALAHRDLPYLVFLTGLSVLLLHDLQLSRIEGLILCLSLLLILWQTVYHYRGRNKQPNDSCPAVVPSTAWRCVGLSVIGVLLLVVGAEVLVASSIGLATMLGVSESIIALTVTAVGTGIPEIAVTFLAVARGQHAMALGNVVGSNLMNLGFVLSLSAMASPLTASGLGWLPLMTLLALRVGLWWLVLATRGLSRWVGVSLLSAFGLYNVALIA